MWRQFQDTSNIFLEFMELLCQALVVFLSGNVFNNNGVNTRVILNGPMAIY